MGRGKPTRKRFWRLRSNPLRRRDDIIEAWVVLAAWTFAVVGGTTAGLVTAHATEATLAQQRAERHSVHAVLLAHVPKPPAGRLSSGDKALAEVRWTASDGSNRTGSTLVDAGLRPGTRLVVWQDSHGALVTEPSSAAEAALEGAVMGGFAGLSLVGGVCAVGALARWRLDQRRMAGWDREWDLVGPKWGYRTG
ncbi:Rv1733c family protein [Streptomyces fructofermentans]|uniref:Rv1733c family protein n=1 Tax=Streptomyces fructofermentans TaxID=152141 RepID=UPI00378EF5E5